MTNETTSRAPATTRQTGSCHCGTVHYEVSLDLTAPVSRCNCSICTKVNPSGAIVKPEAFRLVQGEANLSSYEWGSKMSRRFFCKTCGVHCFGRGFLAELGGDFVSINLNTLDGVDLSGAPAIHWDGRHNNWQAGPRSTPWPMFTAASEAAA